MYSVLDFVEWLKTHAESGSDPWVYLMGTSGHKVTQKLLDAKYNGIYHKKMTREQFDALTAGWVENKRVAADCQGLADAYCTQVLGVPTEVTSNVNYTDWCTQRGSVKKITRPYVLGEAVFMARANGHVHHVGFVCGFDGDEPLVVEARGIYYGVVTTRLHERPWTHRGLMTEKFDYGNQGDVPTGKIYRLESPVIKGSDVKALQKALNAAGYRDMDGKKLAEDSKCGKRTIYALTKFVEAHQHLLPQPEQPGETPAGLPEEIVADVIIDGAKYSGQLLKQKN